MGMYDPQLNPTVYGRPPIGVVGLGLMFGVFVVNVAHTNAIFEEKYWFNSSVDATCTCLVVYKNSYSWMYKIHCIKSVCYVLRCSTFVVYASYHALYAFSSRTLGLQSESVIGCPFESN